MSHSPARREVFIAVWILISVLPASAFSQATEVCTLRDKSINESSGLAVSRTAPGHWWVHNDSGDDPRLFLVDASGKTKKIVRVDGAKAVDWEDMCSFTMAGEHWLLIGDTGDNARKRGKSKPECRLYLLKEPDPKKIKGTKGETNVDIRIDLEYEDGRFNCEAVAVDTVQNKILLLTKETVKQCGLYSIPLDLKDRRQNRTAKKLGKTFLPLVTAMDIAPDGSSLAICTMLHGILISRRPQEDWGSALSRPGIPLELPPRKQGETMCFSRDGRQLFLNSEGTRQPLWRMDVPAKRTSGKDSR